MDLLQGKMATAVCVFLDIDPEWIVSKRAEQSEIAEKTFDIIVRWDGADYVLTWEQLVALALEAGWKTDALGRAV